MSRSWSPPVARRSTRRTSPSLTTTLAGRCRVALLSPDHVILLPLGILYPACQSTLYHCLNLNTLYNNLFTDATAINIVECTVLFSYGALSVRDVFILSSSGSQSVSQSVSQSISQSINQSISHLFIL